MVIHTYVVQHDKGFAPNPFWGICTLACCKPRIRAKASVGDIILGFDRPKLQDAIKAHKLEPSAA